MIKAFLFDIGNVLVKFDHAPAVAKIQAHCAASAEEIRAVVTELIGPLETGTISTAEFLERAVAGLHYTGPQQEFADAYCDIFTLNEPMWDVVATVAPKYPLYFFSNTSELHLAFLERTFPAQMALFTGGIFSMRVGAMKPEDKIYRAAVAMLQVEPGEIYYLDDLEANIEAGKKHGFQTHRYLWPQHEALLAEVGRVL
jgi:putative hydrolase of the HAD superfamily